MTDTMTAPALNGTTGLQWASQNPDKARQLLMLFADGHSLRELHAETGANIRTIRAYLRSAGVWKACSKAIADTARLAAQQLADRLLTEADDVPLENVAGALKTAIDVANALDGTPTTVVEHRHTHSITQPTLESVQEFKARLIERRAAIEAETVTIPDNTPKGH